MLFSAYIYCTDKSGNVLVIEDKNNLFELPGGRLETGESPIRAATRLIISQTGYKVDHNKLRLVFQNEIQDGHLALVYLNNTSLNDITITKIKQTFDNVKIVRALDLIDYSPHRNFYKLLLRSLGIGKMAKSSWSSW